MKPCAISGGVGVGTVDEYKHIRGDQIYLSRGVYFSLPASFKQPLQLFGYWISCKIYTDNSCYLISSHLLTNLQFCIWEYCLKYVARIIKYLLQLTVLCLIFPEIHFVGIPYLTQDLSCAGSETFSFRHTFFNFFLPMGVLSTLSINLSKSELCVSDIKTENFFLYRLTCFVMLFLDCRIFSNRLLWLFGLRQKKRTLDDTDCLLLTSSWVRDFFWFRRPDSFCSVL